jgi:hypothetical protein
MFRAVHRSSSGALTVFAASGLYMHVVTGRSQVPTQTWLRPVVYKLHFNIILTYKRKSHRRFLPFIYSCLNLLQRQHVLHFLFISPFLITIIGEFRSSTFCNFLHFFINLIFMDPYIAVQFSINNQQGATL